MPADKDYFIRLLLKRTNGERVMGESIRTLMLLCKNTYPNITEDDIQAIGSQFSIEAYLKKVIAVIDGIFTLEEIKELLHFFSSPLGRKFYDPNFLITIEKIGENLSAEIEQEFSIRNARNSKQKRGS